MDAGRTSSNTCPVLNEATAPVHNHSVNTDIAQISPFITVRIAGDVLVKVPNSLELITPYILREQEDWFEDEIKFLRKLIQPGSRVIDVGANYGTYTLSLARTVGDQGHVWAFEPASTTAEYLRASVTLNQFNNVSVMQSAVSNQVGKARLCLEKNSELNRVSTDTINAGEKIELTTLDSCLANLGFGKVDFLKIDAEGEEKNVVLGGKQFLSTQSPLIMFELRHADTFNLALIKQFGNLGYSTYRLIPGLDILVPFGKKEKPDSYLLNLFCCKEDRALTLEKGGWLIRRPPESCASADDKIKSGDRLEETYLSFPFARRMKGQWEKQLRAGADAESDSNRKAIQLYLLAHSDHCNASERYAALSRCFELLDKLAKNSPKLPYLSTFLRVSVEMGFCDNAVNTIPVILAQPQIQSAMGDTSFNEPFLPPSQRFDLIDPDGRIDDWFLAALTETNETISAYSSYYADKSSLRNLELLRKYGFQSPEMERRRQLMSMRYGMQSAPEASDLLATYTESNLNPGLWGYPQENIRSAGTKVQTTMNHHTPVNTEPTAKRQLHIGGQVRKDGWEVLNVSPAPYVDHVCNAGNLTIFHDNTFDVIYASHILEHLDYNGALLAALKEWQRVLKPSGTIYISVPDMDVLAALFLLSKERLATGERFEVMRMMFGGHIDNYDYHFVGLNEEFLTDFLASAGFENIRRVEEFGFFDDTSSHKFRNVPISLNMVAGKPANMSTGRNEPCPCGSGQKFKHCHGKVT